MGEKRTYLTYVFTRIRRCNGPSGDTLGLSRSSINRAKIRTLNHAPFTKHAIYTVGIFRSM